MKRIVIDIKTGQIKGNIDVVENDNKSDIYKIYILKNKAIYDLTSKTPRMVMIDKKQNIKQIIDLNITDAKRGEVSLQVSDAWSRKDGRYMCQLAIFGSEGFLEQSIYFWINIKNSLFNDIGGEILADPQFEMLKQELEKFQIAFSKINEWDKYFEETSGKIEEKYTERLNEIDSQLSENEKKIIFLEDNKAEKKSVYTKNDVYNKDQINNKTWSMANMGQDVKEAMTGGSVAVVGREAVDNENLKKNAVTYDKTTYEIPGLLKMLDSLFFDKVTKTLTVPNGYCVRSDFGGRHINASDFPDKHPNGKFEFRLLDNADMATLYFDIEKAKNNEYPFIWLNQGYEQSQIEGRYQEIAKVSSDGIITKYSIEYETPQNSITIDKIDFDKPFDLIISDTFVYNETNRELKIPHIAVFDGVKWHNYESTNIIIPNENPYRIYFDIELCKRDENPFIYKQDNSKIEQEGYRYEEIIRITGKSIVSEYSYKYKEAFSLKFDENKNRLIVPSEMFFIEEEPLTIYKNSMLADRENQETYKTCINSEEYIKYFYENYDLNPSDLNNEFYLDVVSNQKQGYVFRSNVKKISKRASDVTKKNVNVINFGDSVTATGIPSGIKEYCGKYGITLNMLGTAKDSKQTNCEARSGWMYSNYIGASGLDINTNSAITEYPSFLKLATNEDKQKHPNWCFRRTGSKYEKSYSEDENKEGDFYIFDFGYYLDTNNYENVDLVTIAMGTNDFGVIGDLDNNPEKAYELCGLAVEIIIKQILKASPNTKIALIPTHTFGSGQYKATFQKYMIKWIEECYRITDNFPEEIKNNVDIVGIYAHCCGDLGGLKIRNDGFIPNSRIYIIEIEDNTHPDEIGIKEYSKSLAYWCINRID